MARNTNGPIRHCMRKRLLFALAIACAMPGMAMASTAAAPGSPQVRTGYLQGAPYRIDVPARWNGDLVVLMHGYERKGAPRTIPWPQGDEVRVFLSRGYAVASSAYASQGWAVSDALTDSARLQGFFSTTFNKPHRTYAVGFSLGGLEVVAALEQEKNLYDGGLSLCGADVSAPELIARAALEPLVAFDTDFPGVLPDLAGSSSPAMIDPQRIRQALQSNPAKAKPLETRLQETDATLPSSLALNYMILRELEQRAGGMPVDTRTTFYRGFGNDEAFNRAVHRYQGSPAAMAYLARNVTLTGHFDAPLVLMWNAFDPIIPARFHDVYPQMVRAAGNATRMTVLPPVGSGHCAFTNDQIGHAFDVLVDHVHAGKSSLQR